jgi:hypothetical protein
VRKYVALAAVIILTAFGVGSGLRPVAASTVPIPDICVQDQTTAGVPDIVPVVVAVQQQLDLDLQTYWHQTARLYPSCVLHPTAWKVYLVDDDPAATNVFGYHYQTDDEIPYGVIIMSVLKQYHKHWSITFSHEVLEIVVDPIPGVSPLTVTRPSDGALIAVEIGDPVHNRTYRINNVEVSDFATPAWFGLYPKEPYDFLGYLRGPFILDLDGGYIPVIRKGE